jgi:hypothetical protein
MNAVVSMMESRKLETSKKSASYSCAAFTHRDYVQHQRTGVTAFLSGDLAGAHRSFEDALTVALGIYGQSDARTAVALLLLARILKAKGELVESELLKSRGQSILAKGIYVVPAGGSSGFWSLLGY